MSDTPALNIPIRAEGLDTFKSQMNETSLVAANAARRVTEAGIKMSAGFLASQGAAGAATLAFGRLLGFLGPIALGVTAVIDTFEFLKKSVELAGQQIETFNAIAAKANSAGVGTNFFQRFTNSAPKAVLSIDQVTEALESFNKATTDKLGGSDLQKRIDEFTKIGGFAGNSGVAAFARSPDTETRLRAIVSLIDQAMQKGERFAALDIADKAFGPALTAALRADSGFLDQMLQKADAMSKAEIISQDDIGRAIELKDRIEAAQQILEAKWVPIERDMGQLGMNAKANWASVVEVFAQLVGLADRLYATLKQIPDAFAHFGNLPIWKAIVDATTTPEGRAAAEAAAGGSSDKKDIYMDDARARLGAALRNPGDRQRALEQAQYVQSYARGDTSKNPDKHESSDTTDAVDRSINSLSKHIQEQEADTRAIGLGDAALAKFKAQAQETAAVQTNHGKETAAQAAQFKELQQRASDAADALAKAKVNSEISYSRQTAFLTPDDAAIATKLKGIYGDDIPRALNSSEASALRLNNALKGLGDAFTSSINGPLLGLETGTMRASTAFQQFGAQFSRTLLQMLNQYLIIKPMLSGIGSVFGMTGLGSSTSTAAATPSIPGFASGTDSAPGGLAIVGERGPELVNLPKGAQVIPNGPSAKLLKNIPGFADGGVIGGGTPAPLFGGNATTIAPTFHVNVQGNPGSTSAQHKEMGATIAKAAQDQIQAMIGEEIRRQTRPGGILRS